MIIQKITIGIPIYNERLNIRSLINSINHQKGVLIEKIIISSDGSTDNTVDVINGLKDKRIKLITNKSRKGVARGLNQIIKLSKSKILVTLDADIKIKDNRFLEKLVNPIANLNIQMTASRISEVEPKYFFDTMLYVSMSLKENLFSVFKDGQNIYTCHGLARAYSDKIYRKIHFPHSVGNDMYSYLFCISKGGKFQYVSRATTYYKLPQHLKDHMGQSTRFFNAIDVQVRYFEPTLIKNEINIPFLTYFTAMIKSFPLMSRYPLHIIMYILIQMFARFFSLFTSTNDMWKIASSTKNHE